MANSSLLHTKASESSRAGTARARPLTVTASRAGAQKPGPASTRSVIREGLDLGITSVMFDAAASPYAENVARTEAVVERCHAAGCRVEAELGEIGGKDGAHAPGVRTDPDQAREFVAATGVDSLAVAVGSSHAMADRSAVLDEELIAALACRVPVPLVLHGSSGVPDEGLRGAVASGIVKVNIGTRLNQVLTEAVRSTLGTHGPHRPPPLPGPRSGRGPGRGGPAAHPARELRTGHGRVANRRSAM